MNSLEREITSYTISADVRMQRQVHKGAFVILEGPSDHKRFRKLLAHNHCCVIIGYGKENVTGAVKLLYDAGITGVLGLVDADFDRVLSLLPQNRALIVSDSHDFDIDLIRTPALERYLYEVAELDKLILAGGAAGVLDELLESIRALTMLRFINVKYKFCFQLRRLELRRFYNGTHVDIDRMISCIPHSAQWNADQIATLRGLIEAYLLKELDLFQLTSGHDLCAALGIALRQRLARRPPEQTKAQEIEMHIRLSSDLHDFKQTGICSAVRSWESENRPYQIMVTDGL